MARWKSDGQGGAYFDPNDSGPDQVTPPPMATSQGGGGPMPGPGDMSFPMGSEGPGGITGRAEDPNFKLDPSGVAGGSIGRQNPGEAMAQGQPVDLTQPGKLSFGPGEGGMWAMGGGKNIQTIEDLLAALGQWAQVKNQQPAAAAASNGIASTPGAMGAAPLAVAQAARKILPNVGMPTPSAPRIELGSIGGAIGRAGGGIGSAIRGLF